MSFISKSIILLLFIIIIQCMCKHCVLQEGFSLNSIKDKMEENKDLLEKEIENKEIDLEIESENLKQKKLETEKEKIDTEKEKLKIEESKLENEMQESKNKFMTTLSGMGTGMLEEYADENDIKIVK